MRSLLTTLTLLLTAVVVLVLATYLIRIAAALVRADRNLAQLVVALERVRDQTAPLADDLPTINAAAATLAERLVAADAHLQAILRTLRPTPTES